MKIASRPRPTLQPLMTSVNHAVFLALTILLLLSLADPVRQASADEAGDFDYYILTLSWSPTYCADEARRNRDQLQCFSERSYGFVIHGLWPQYERGYPERCRTRFRDPSDNLVEQMLKFSPSESLIRHEWDKHGSCSGLLPLDYFRLAVRSFKALKRPDKLADLDRPLLMTVPQIESAFHDANPGLPEDSLFVTCKRQKLSEVRLCLDKKGKPRQCSPSAIRARCGSRDKLRILAVR
ncbi:ribonuclease T2 family protein [Cohaesibacter haloalkalitolerans]|uniref:ribonuclease T2 family protein n=1 Tax=Cohaesibacter haloalkalitolerans TaxID=1162980 RepID=UPI0013C4DEF5|nr:ribonuclease T [Cohaesibacter haloalkalitolerans]